MKRRVSIQPLGVNELHSPMLAFIGEESWLLSPKDLVLKASILAFCFQQMLRVCKKEKPSFTKG